MTNDKAPQGDDKGILSRGLVTLVGAVLGACLVFGNEILVARFLGLTLYGLYALALVIARIAESVSLFGLRSGLMHFLPVFLTEGQVAKASGSVAAALLLPMALGLASLAAVWVGAPWISQEILHEPDAVPYLRLFALPIPLMCMVEMLGVITRGFGRAELYVIIRNLTPPACYMLLLLMLIGFDGDALSVGRAFAAGQLIATGVGLFIVMRVMRGESAWVKPSFQFTELYRYSFPIMLNTLLYTLMAASDVLMLANLQGTSEAGIYRACIQFRPAFDMAVLAFNAAAIHLYPVYHQEGRVAELAQSYGTVIRMTSVVTAIVFVLVFLSRRDILGMLGPEFPAGGTAMAFLLVGFLFQGCLGSSGVLLVVTGHQRYETVAAFLGVVVNIGLNLVLIPMYGIVGAGMATATALLIMNLLRVYFVYVKLQLSTLSPDIARSLLLGAIVVALVSVLVGVLGMEDGAGLLAMIGRSGAALLLLVFAFWRFGPKVKEQ